MMHETHDPHRGPKLLSWTCGRHRNASCSQLRDTDETGGPEWERMEFKTYLKVEPERLVGRLDEVGTQNRVIKDDSIFGLNNWTDGGTIN